MPDVPRPARLRLRGASHTYRVRVPNDLRLIVGKREIWRSFGQVSAKEAARLSRLESVKTDALFAEARAKLAAAAPAPPPSDASSDAIYAAVRAHFHRLEQGAARPPFADEAREAALLQAQDEAAGVHGTPVEDGSMQRVAREIAAEARLGAPDGSAAFWELLSAVKRAADEFASRNVDRANLQPVARRDPAFADITAGKPPARILTLSGAVKAFREAPEKVGKAAKTHAAYRFRLGAWLDLLGGDRPVAEITRAEIKAARDVLLTVPANVGKRFPGKSLREAAALSKRQSLEPMHPKSARLYLDVLASLFKWLVIEGEIASNPALSIGTPPPDESKARRPMTIPELQKLFTSGPYAKPEVVRGWRWWAPLIALFQGLRIAEITGLSAADVCERDGVPCILVRPNDTRNLKTKQSARIVPVHPVLVELGFVEFAGSMPPTGPLFIDLPGRRDDAANAAQKALAYAFRQMFPEDRRVVFHSLRHSWADALRNAYVPRDMAERLGGWKPSGSAFTGYGAGHRPSLLAAEIAKVGYNGLDLDHLSSLMTAQWTLSRTSLDGLERA